MKPLRHLSLVAAAALALAAPGAASAGDASAGEGWSLTLGVWGGVSHYDVLGLSHGVASVGTADGQDLIQGNFNTVGASAVLRLGALELGALYEGTLLDGDAKNEVLTPLVGLAWDLSDTWRLDLLAELGGHKIEGIGSGNDFLSGDTKTVWLPYVGVRPSLSWRMPLGPTRLVLSLTPFARWDLVKKEVTVDTSSGPTSTTTYEAGGTTFGVVGGVGIEL